MPAADNNDPSNAELMRGIQEIKDGMKELVRHDVYEADRRNTDNRIDAASRIAWWALGLVGTTLFGLVVKVLLDTAAKGHP